MATETQCEEALVLHENSLSQRANVVGLGITSADDSNPASADVAVAVYVSRKVPLDELAEEDRIPETLEIEEQGGKKQVPVQIVELGAVELEEPGLE